MNNTYTDSASVGGYVVCMRIVSFNKSQEPGEFVDILNNIIDLKPIV